METITIKFSNGIMKTYWKQLMMDKYRLVRANAGLSVLEVPFPSEQMDELEKDCDFYLSQYYPFWIEQSHLYAHMQCVVGANSFEDRGETMEQYFAHEGLFALLRRRHELAGTNFDKSGILNYLELRRNAEQIAWAKSIGCNIAQYLTYPLSCNVHTTYREVAPTIGAKNVIYIYKWQLAK